MEFRAELESSGANTAGFRVPDGKVAELNGGNHPKVAVIVNGFSFRTSIARMGGEFWLGVSSDRRAEAEVTTGDTYDVTVELDTAPRTVEMPDDLGAALAGNPAARAFWDTLTHSKQSWHVLQVTGAKKPETRAARVAKSVAMLAEGRAR